MGLNRGVESAWWALRIGLGLTAFLAGLDKFFDISLAEALRTPRRETAA